VSTQERNGEALALHELLDSPHLADDLPAISGAELAAIVRETEELYFGDD